MDLDLNAKIYVAGHRGMVGSAIWRELHSRGATHLLGRTRAELDLRLPGAVDHFFTTEQPHYVIVAAAKVGGIFANDSQPVEFLLENLEIQNNLISAAHRHRIRKLLFLGSSCIYPRLAPQPLKEEYLLSGPLELTNEWYALAKIAGIKLCQAYRRQYRADFISAMPTNLYGPNDNYDLEQGHVLPALIRRFHEAKELRAPQVICWGTGEPLREFLYVDDLARACVLLLERYSEENFINVGSSSEISIRGLADLIRETVGYEGEVVWDKTKPDGTPRKLMDSSRITALGFVPEISLRAGIALAYQDFLRIPQPKRGPSAPVALGR